MKQIMSGQNQIIEKGIIKGICGDRVSIEIIHQDSENCKTCGICMGIERKSNILEAKSIPDIAVGDLVQLQINKPSPYKSIFLLFFLPILSLFIGSFIGREIRFICPDSENLRMVICGFVFFLLSIACSGLYEKRRRNIYQLRILKYENYQACV